MLATLIAILVGCSGAQAAPPPAFRYELGIDPSQYGLKIEMSFSPDVTLGQLVANFRNGALLHEFNPDADPIQTVNVHGPGGALYDQIMSWRAFGIRTSQLSHCQERENAQGWMRECEVDISVLDAGKYTDWKRDRVTCAARPEGPSCTLDIAGRIRNFLFMKGSVLTLKAKRQALINWGRFWFLTENGSVSTRLSNPLFDRSKLKAEIESLLSENLSEAKAHPESFRLQRATSFSAAAAR